MNELSHHGCHAYDGPWSRRTFIARVGGAIGTMALGPVSAMAADRLASGPRPREGARVRAAFLYPPSSVFKKNPNGWWSWPGNDFDAEDRQRQYVAAFSDMGKRLGLRIVTDEQPVADKTRAGQIAKELATDRPDGLLLVMFYNRSLGLADVLLKAAEEVGIPVVFYIGLGVKHGSVKHYRRLGVYFIQSLDNLDAIEYGMRMINAKKFMSQSKLLSITEAPKPREGVERFFGTTVRVLPFTHYSEVFHKATIDDDTRALIAGLAEGAKELRGITQQALDNAARAHIALKQLLASEQAHGLTMNCLRRGMLNPCISFSALNGQLIPAACENDFSAMYTQLLGQLLTGRPGFQHNPCFDTERNHYYGSHCTCPTKMYGPDGPELPYLLRRFAHTNEGSCAIQVFWKPGDPVTMMRYHPGKEPALDVYAGKVVKSHSMPPAGGCTTNVEIEITDRPDACMVGGHHNLIFCGDFARKFRLFAQLHRMRLAKTGYSGLWPL